jgi:hypothetical protein
MKLPGEPVRSPCEKGQRVRISILPAKDSERLGTRRMLAELVEQEAAGLTVTVYCGLGSQVQLEDHRALDSGERRDPERRRSV